jgi:hypothetical protein
MLTCATYFCNLPPFLVPFREVLANYNSVEPGRPSVDLQPEIGLRVENDYREKGASRISKSALTVRAANTARSFWPRIRSLS